MALFERYLILGVPIFYFHDYGRKGSFTLGKSSKLTLTFELKFEVEWIRQTEIGKGGEGEGMGEWFCEIKFIFDNYWYLYIVSIY